MKDAELLIDNSLIIDESSALTEAKLRRTVERLKEDNRIALSDLANISERLRVMEMVSVLSPQTPKWTSRKKWGSSDAVVVAMLSDLHLDEIVRAEDVGGINAYNREIALERLRTWAEKMSALASYGPTANVKGIVIMLGGDLLNGDIHEGRATNQDTLLGSMLFWSEHLAAAIDMVAGAFESAHVVSIVGNHGRMTMKPHYKLKSRDNADWHLSHLIQRATVNKEITWNIPETPDVEVMIMGQRHILTHGDETRGGGGIGGIWPPIKRMVSKKQGRYSGLGKPFDCVWMGHWHQLTWADNFVVNGNLKGPDEYAQSFNFLAESPEQAVAYITSRGVDWRTSIVVDKVGGYSLKS